MSFPEAFKGAKAELATIHSPIDKLKRIATYARIIGAELLSTIQIIPYGIRSQALYRSLPEIRLGVAHQGSISTARHISYGPGERNTLDIYLPAEAEITHPIDTINKTTITLPNNAVSNATNTNTSTTSSRLPVVLFCHGGIWATGEKWHYAPLATRLAQAGIVTAIMSYSLYPKALAGEMTAEVSQALTWTLDNITSLGGDPSNITLAGHSAGAQLCAMALLHRASSQGGNVAGEDGQVKKNIKNRNVDLTAAGEGSAEAAAFSDARMPKRFVGIAGVYDVAKHYEYERARGVHTLSTMERAVGGISCFDANSPSVILRACLERESPLMGSGSSRSENALLDRDAFNLEKSEATSMKLNNLHGDLLAQRIGLDRTSIKASTLVKKTTTTSAAPAASSKVKASNLLGTLSLTQARNLPPTILQASTSDTTVPWYESSDLHWTLCDCGIPSKCLVYNRVGHGDFVVNWRPLPSPLDVHTTEDLDGYASDFVNIVLGEE